jgi:hypothetical protein
MTRDPAEGVSDGGVVVTGVGTAPIGAPYDRVVEVAADRMTTELGDALHGLYVYGSVATGQAAPPTSDLDLHAVLHVDEAETCRRVAGDLTAQFTSVVREVGISTVRLDHVQADTLEGHAERCWVRHYCRHVAGHDLRPELPDCRVSVELARGFNGDVDVVMDRLVERLRAPSLGAAERRRTVAQGSRKLLMSAATLLSVRGGRWTTDRQEGALLLVAAAPALSTAVARVVTWTTLDVSTDTTPTQAEVLTSFGQIRHWLAREYRAAEP